LPDRTGSRGGSGGSGGVQRNRGDHAWGGRESLEKPLKSGGSGAGSVASGIAGGSEGLLRGGRAMFQKK